MQMTSVIVVLSDCNVLYVAPVAYFEMGTYSMSPDGAPLTTEAPRAQNRQ